MANVNKRYFTDKKLLQPFAFLLDNIDSVSDHKPFLPVYMTEALSDYYYSNDPHRIREEIKAAKTDGIKNESILQFIGGMNQKVNVYENFSTALGKEFISPLSDVGDKYYNYRGADTQYISGQRYLHLFFTPKREVKTLSAVIAGFMAVTGEFIKSVSTFQEPPISTM